MDCSEGCIFVVDRSKFHRIFVYMGGRSAKEQEHMDSEVKKLQDSIFDDIGDVKSDVFKENKELTDDIDNVEPVQGSPGPPGQEGPHGINGINGIHGAIGLQGQRGKRGIAGPQGKVGVMVRQPQSPLCTFLFLPSVWLGLCLLSCNTAPGSFGIVKYIFGMNDHNCKKKQETEHKPFAMFAGSARQRGTPWQIRLAR